jgi:hypothetical protein
VTTTLKPDIDVLYIFTFLPGLLRVHANMTILPMMDPPPYKPVEAPTTNAHDDSLKIIVGLDYGTTNSGRYSTVLSENEGN